MAGAVGEIDPDQLKVTDPVSKGHSMPSSLQTITDVDRNLAFDLHPVGEVLVVKLRSIDRRLWRELVDEQVQNDLYDIGDDGRPSGSSEDASNSSLGGQNQSRCHR